MANTGENGRGWTLAEKAKIRKGDLLIASKALLDPNFQQTVVLLCEHQKEGSYGLVLNRPIEVPEAAIEEFPFIKEHLYQGGPVQPQALQIIHPFGKDVGNAVEVIPGVWVGGDFELMRKQFSMGTLDAGVCRFFLGYSGWGAGQLAMEFEADSWLSVRATRELVLETPASRIWVEAVRERGKRDPLYSHFPDNPSLN